MSCCGQKRSEQKRQAGTPAADANQRGSRPGQPSGRVRPRDQRPGNAALRAYLTRNAKLFTR
jgi:hypothetical protein